MAFSKVFKINSSGFHSFGSELQSQLGIDFSRNSASFINGKYQGDYEYNPETGRLAVRFSKTPRLVPDKMIKSRLIEAINKHGGREL